MSEKPKIIIAGSGASGAIYLQRLLDLLAKEDVQLYLVLSKFAKSIAVQELGRKLKIPKNARSYSISDMNSEIASGSNIISAMCILPCSMATCAKLAHGIADNLICRSADVMLKEKRQLIICPRETPMSQIHLKNLAELASAGAHIFPACPSFYNKPEAILDIVDSVVHRILDHLPIPKPHAYKSFRWTKPGTEAYADSSKKSKANLANQV